MTPELESEVGRCVFREANDAFLIVRPDNLQLVEANPAAQRLTGLRRKHLQSMTLPDLIERDGDISDLLAACRSTNYHPARTRYRLKSADGAGRIVHISVSRLHTDAETLGLLVIRDVTAAARAEEAQRLLERQLLHAQKLESLGVLAGGVAHDFNNLLTVILGNLELIEQELPADSAARPLLAPIGGSARRAADLCRQMLAYAGRSDFALDPVDLNTVVRDAAELLKLSVSKKATLALRLADGLPPALGDAAQLCQVLMNLVSNASEALGPAGGTVTVTTAAARVTAEELNGFALTPDPPEAGEFVQLEVTDSGCGMDAATLAQVFDPFFTTKFAGRGLGLAVVHGIARAHRAALAIESVPGRGTTVRLLLPRAATEPAPRPLSAHDLVAWHTSGTVVVADDEPSVRHVVARNLERVGLTVVEASDGAEALAALRASGDVRLLVLDWTMPQLDGGEVLAALSSEGRALPVIVMSGYADQAVGAAADGRVRAVLRKPFPRGELLEAVRLALGVGA